MRSPDQRLSSDHRQQAQALLLDGQRPAAGSIENWRELFPDVIGRSDAMMKVLETVAKVARSDSSVLILGESGTGKELIASAIHRLSNRSPRPFIALNCCSIPETLLESELFGHEKGAFTGADRRYPGKFEMAALGTIFLDEIGDMPGTLQAKLLRVLQERKFTPLGGTELKNADVRIVAATNRSLESEVKAGKFRLDLYYRLNVVPIMLPPLRERRDDVADLLQHFLDRSNRVHAPETPCFFDGEVLRVLQAYRWPGNVRELQNVVERLVVLKSGGKITPADLPDEMLDADVSTDDAPGLSVHARMPLPAHPASPKTASGEPMRMPQNSGQLPTAGIDLVKFIEDLENDLIRQALERTGNNRNQAAKLLGLNRTTLVERIKKRKLCPLKEPSKEL